MTYPNFVIDVPKIPIGGEVTLVGIIKRKFNFRKNVRGLRLQDITGSIMVVMNLDDIGINSENEMMSFVAKKRLSVTGEVQQNSKDPNKLVIKNIKSFQILDSEFFAIDSDTATQASRLLISKIINTSSLFLSTNRFSEIDPKVLSSQWTKDGLEPLIVQYPGFGANAFLTTSPSAQLMEFLTITMLPRVFCVSKSFSSSYRFPSGSAEITIIMSKATNATLNEQKKAIVDIANKLLSEFSLNIDVEESKKIWGERNSIKNVSHDKDEASLKLVCYKSHIPVVGENWNTFIDTIMHLTDNAGNILIEGINEQLSADANIATMTIYPSQILNLLEDITPRRQLENLMGLYDE